MSLCRAQVDALREARDAEPDARLHPDGDLDYNVDETFHRDSSDNPVIFGSPLLRELRVLDASIDPTRHDFDWDYQGILDGRGLTLSTVLGNVASTQLVAVDLHGQSIEARDPLGLERPNKAVRERVATLTHLDVGGGHPLGDAALRQLARRCPAIERLSLSPGPAGDVLTDHDFDEWEEGEGRDSVYGRLHEHWRIYGNEDIEHMRASSAGWRALGKLEHLERLIVGSMHDASPVGTDVEIVVDDGWAPASRLALWQQWFDA